MEKQELEQVINEVDRLWMTIKSGLDNALLATTTREKLRRIDELVRGLNLPALQNDIGVLMGYKYPVAVIEIEEPHPCDECHIVKYDLNPDNCHGCVNEAMLQTYVPPYIDPLEASAEDDDDTRIY